MTKAEFLSALRARLSGLPEEDLKKSIEYYSEMIDDRMEDGLSEEDAVAAVGSIDEIVAQILSDTSLPKLVKEKVRPKRALHGWEILLLVLGFPLWFPLLIAGASVLFALFIAFWSVVFAICVVGVSFAACGIAGIFGSLAFIPLGNWPNGLLFFGGGLIFAGLTILVFLFIRLVVKVIFAVSKTILLGIKACFVRKEGAS